MDGGGGASAPGLSEQEQQFLDLMSRQTQEEFRVRDVGGGEFEDIPFEEWLAGLDPDQRENELIKQEGRSSILRTLRGDTEGTVQGKRLEVQRQQMHEQLLKSGIQPGSSAYSDSMAKFEESAAFTAEGLRTSALATGAGAARGVPAGPNIGNTGIGLALQTLGQSRNLATQVDVANVGAAATREAGFFSAIGQGAGIGIGTYAALSSEEYKEDIEDIDAKEALESIRNLPIKRFSYKPGHADGGAKKHVGFMTQDAPVDVLGAGGDNVELYSTIGLTIAALKELDNELKEIKKSTKKAGKRSKK